METYHLKSKLVENDKEFVIQTNNDANLGAILSTVYVDGQVTEKVQCPHPQEINPEELLSLVKLTHQDQKREIEILLDAYRKALAGGNAEMVYHLGTAFFYKRLYDEARQLFQAAVTLNRDHHQAFNYLGMTQLAQNMVAEAIESCSIAVEKRPAYADYRNNLGEALLADNSCQRAVRELEEAVRINLYYADAYFNLGLTFVLDALNIEGSVSRADLPAKAADYFKKASLICPDYEATLLEEAMSALHRSDLKGAFSVFLKVREAKKEKHRREFATFYMKFVIYPDWVSEEVIGDRIRFLQAEIEKNPTYVDLHTELARCFLEYAKLSWQKGLEQYKKTLQINPSLTRAQHCLDKVEREYENIGSVLSDIAEKS